MRKSIAADCLAGTSNVRRPRYEVTDRVRLDPGTTIRVVVGRTQVHGLWVYDCVREAAAGAHPLVAFGEHLLRRAE